MAVAGCPGCALGIAASSPAAFCYLTLAPPPASPPPPAPDPSPSPAPALAPSPSASPALPPPPARHSRANAMLYLLGLPLLLLLLFLAALGLAARTVARSTRAKVRGAGAARTAREHGPHDVVCAGLPLAPGDPPPCAPSAALQPQCGAGLATHVAIPVRTGSPQPPARTPQPYHAPAPSHGVPFTKVDL